MRAIPNLRLLCNSKLGIARVYISASSNPVDDGQDPAWVIDIARPYIELPQ